MAVILPNARLGLRTRMTHPLPRDDYGTPLPPVEAAQLVAAGPLLPGYAKERPGEGDAGEEWSLRLDPSLWPLEKGDQITDGSRVWALDYARLHTHPVAPDVDYVEAQGRLETPEVL